MPCCIFSDKVSSSEHRVGSLYLLPIPSKPMLLCSSCCGWRHLELALVLTRLSENTHPLVSMGDWGQGSKESGCSHPLYKIVWYLHAVCAHVLVCFKSSLCFLDTSSNANAIETVCMLYYLGNDGEKHVCTFQYRCKFLKNTVFSIHSRLILQILDWR